MRVTKLTQQRNVHVQVPHGAENQSITEKLLCRSRLLGFEADVCASVESDIIKSRWPQVSMLRVVTGNELPVSILKPLRLLHPNNSSCSFILSPKDWMCRRAEQTERETGWQVNTNYWQHLLQKTTWNQPLFHLFGSVCETKSHQQRQNKKQTSSFANSVADIWKSADGLIELSTSTVACLISSHQVSQLLFQKLAVWKLQLLNQQWWKHAGKPR